MGGGGGGGGWQVNFLKSEFSLLYILPPFLDLYLPRKHSFPCILPHLVGHASILPEQGW